MRFLAPALFLLTGTVFAAPFTHIRRERALRRSSNTGIHSNPIHRVEAPDGELTNNTNVQYSSNWAGAVLSGTGYTSVTGTFTVPKPSTAGSGTAWVGIDGDTCGTAILQTGVDWTKSGSSYSYDAWYEWYPDYSYDFTGITISAGDVIKVTVTAKSTTGGTAVVDNVTTGKSVSHTFSGESSDSLCEYDAEWIVEDYEEGSSLVSFADFGSVTFTDASATHNGGTVGTTGATIIDIKQNNEVLTSCSVPSSSSVECSYV